MGVLLELNKDLIWQSDWNGDEVGFDDVPVVGLYAFADHDLYFYIDMENMRILQAFCLCDSE